jgi:HSP20 family molecular chaperone IbpA
VRPLNAVFLDLQRHVDQLLEELVFRPWAVPPPAEWRPALDLYETPEAFLVEIDLPGVPPEDVTLVAGERTLTLSGRRSALIPGQATCRRGERPHGLFRRVLELPGPVDPAAAQARYFHGTCHVRLPRIPPHRGKPAGEQLQVQYTVRITIAESEEERKHD